MSEPSSAKREEPGWNRRLWGALPTAGHPEIKKKGGGGAKGAGSRHTSQEVTLAMLDYKQCALSTSAVLAVEHTTAATATGVARVQGGRGSSLPLSFILHPFSKRRREWVGRVGSRARKALHWWKVTTWKWMRSGLRRGGEGGGGERMVGIGVHYQQTWTGGTERRREGGGEGWKTRNRGARDKDSDLGIQEWEKGA